MLFNNLHSILPAKTEDVPSYTIFHKKTPTKQNHRDLQRSGTMNRAMPREGAYSRPATREGQGKAATKKVRTEVFEQADGGGPNSEVVGRKW